MDRLVSLASAAHAGFRASIFLQPLAFSAQNAPAAHALGLAQAQLYWSSDGAYCEERSLQQGYPINEDAKLSFMLQSVRGAVHLRLDPADAPGMLKISGIRVRVHQKETPLLALDETTGWESLRMRNGFLRLGDSPALNILSLNSDPNFDLPTLEVGDSPCDLVCEVWLRFTSDLSTLPNLLRPLSSALAAKAIALNATLESQLSDARSALRAREQDLATIKAKGAEESAAKAALNATLESQLSDARSALRAREQDLATIKAKGAEESAARAQAEAALAETRQALAALTDQQIRTEEQLRQAGAAVQALQSAAAQKSQEYRSLRNDANRNLQRAFDLCTLAERETALLQDQMFQRDTKIRQMQDSFSWRATYCLRALRRFLIDPLWGKPRTAQLPPPIRTTVFHRSGFLSLPSLRFRSHIDAPRNWSASNNSITVRGWVFAEDPIPFHQIRAHVGDRFYEGTYALNRPDVAAAFPLSGEALRSGFRIDLTIKDNDERLDLEIANGDDQWHRFFTHQFSLGQGAFLHGSYAHWVKEFDTLTPETISALRHKATLLPSQPLISIVMPVFNTPELWLTKAIDSVKAQVYPRWELCIADDASSLPHVRPLLQRYAAEDQRIKIVYRDTNGRISAASNSALALATAEFTALFDHDDELPPHALLCVAETILRHQDAELIYSDEDKIDESGFRFDPHFKPDWNPDLLTGQNYISHLSVYRTATLRSAGAFREGFEGAQDWDLALRVSERVAASQILHIPRVLYHWRAIDGSTATHVGEKSYVAQSARRTLDEHFSRIAVAATLTPISGGHWHVRYRTPDPAPLVTLIICTRNRRELLVACVESVLTKTNYSNFEILVADNDSDDPELFASYTQMRERGHFEMLPCPGPFNFSVINNRAVREARGEVIALLNNDIEVINPDWLGEMVSHALRPGIGAVGAKLYFPDFRLQHAGVITGLGGVAGHAFKGFERMEPGTPQFRPHLTQNLSAVTAACLVIRKSTYLKAGGLDEKELAVAFNDVDFCLKVEDLGLRNLFTPFAELIHYESVSRGAEDSPDKIRRFQSEIATMRARWGTRLLNDPAYNPNLSLDSEDFALAYPPRVPPLAELMPLPNNLQ
jgi:glycosyltransferase involved in cell wall biosynthesis